MQVRASASEGAVYGSNGTPPAGATLLLFVRLSSEPAVYVPPSVTRNTVAGTHDDVSMSGGGMSIGGGGLSTAGWSPPPPHATRTASTRYRITRASHGSVLVAPGIGDPGLVGARLVARARALAHLDRHTRHL